MQPYMVNIKLSARTLTGALNPQNKGAADWGWQGLIAYGCHSLILVIDPKTAQTLQVLERHKANVVKVKWAKENYHHNIGSPYSLRLASADVTGKIIVWDVATGAARCEIQEHTKPIQEIQHPYERNNYLLDSGWHAKKRHKSPVKEELANLMHVLMTATGK